MVGSVTGTGQRLEGKDGMKKRRSRRIKEEGTGKVFWRINHKGLWQTGSGRCQVLHINQLIVQICTHLVGESIGVYPWQLAVGS